MDLTSVPTTLVQITDDLFSFTAVFWILMKQAKKMFLFLWKYLTRRNYKREGFSYILLIIYKIKKNEKMKNSRGSVPNIE